MMQEVLAVSVLLWNSSRCCAWAGRFWWQPAAELLLPAPTCAFLSCSPAITTVNPTNALSKPPFKSPAAERG